MNINGYVQFLMNRMDAIVKWGGSGGDRVLCKE